ncbi:MAG TPA: TetR/AcrR family transcriptional regulator [Sporichthyaceae bacterium]|jgi:TetR/AcrR family transcriptional repressor of nem operon|nr:TetR/AcrR family transcriptional regulator [Sporichthyaceae bacterium]
MLRTSLRANAQEGPAEVAGRKQFDTGSALQLATDFFRRSGYTSSSIDDLVHETGISRSSLYATFGNKEQLFLTALSHYCATMMERLWVQTALPPHPAMHRFLGDLLDAIEEWGPGGCLMTNTCAEYLAIPTAAQLRVREGLAQQQDQLVTYFQLAAARGELPPGRSAGELADLFVALRQALCLLWKAGESKAKLLTIVEVALTVLGDPPERTTPKSAARKKTPVR